MTIRKTKKKLVDLYTPEHETSEECYVALDKFLEKVYKEYKVTGAELQTFQDKTKNYVINGTYNDIISILEIPQYTRYELNLHLDAFEDVVSLYAAAKAAGRKEG